MINQTYSLPPTPESPLSLWEILTLSFSAYRTSFLFSMRLFWMPCLIGALATLPSAIAPNFYDGAGQEMQAIIACGMGILLSFVLVSYAVYIGVLRTLAFKRMILVSEDSCVPALAFANRFGYKSIVARLVTGAVQGVSLCILFGVFLTIWGGGAMPGAAASAMDVTATMQTPAFIGSAIGVLAASLAIWFFVEFYYACFAATLATEEASWAYLWKHSFELTKSAIFRGTWFVAALEIVASFLTFVCPSTIFMVPQIVKNGWLEGFGASQPILISVLDCLVQFGIGLLLLPVMALCTAYLANDLQLRLKSRA